MGRAKVFHLGPERDRPIFEGLKVKLTDAEEADLVVCTGLFDDETETPADYAATAQRACQRARCR